MKERYYTTGSIYKYKDEYYIVGEWNSHKGYLNLLSWKQSNSTTHVSREDPLRKCFKCNGTKKLANYYLDGYSETISCTSCNKDGLVEGIAFSNIEKVADNMKEFIEKKLMKMFTKD